MTERKVTPATRTIEMLQAHGYTTWITEHWIRYPGKKVPARRKDLLGFIDLIALQPPQPFIWGVQVTTVGNMPARIKKILASRLAKTWLRCGQRIWVVGWKEYVVNKGQPAMKWQHRQKEVILADFE